MVRALALSVFGLPSPVSGFLPCPDGAPPPCASARPARPAALAVAVLCFDNFSRDSGDAYLADGLTEQTIAQLGEVSRLTVASRYAVRRFRGGASQDPAAIGRALNVGSLVSGSVRRAGNRLRVGVELVRAGTGVHVWSEQYDRTDTEHQLSGVALETRQYDATIRFSDSALAADPEFVLAHSMRLLAVLAVNDTASARRSAQALSAVPAFQLMSLFLNTFLNALNGDTTTLRSIQGLVRLAVPSPTQPGSALAGGYTAMMFARLGDRESALAALEAIRPRAAGRRDIMRLPLFDSVRSDPRFQALFNETRPPGVTW